MNNKSIRVKATNKFNYYRLIALSGLSVEDFRSLQQGKTVDVNKEFYSKNKHILEIIHTSGVKTGSRAEVKNGS